MKKRKNVYKKVSIYEFYSMKGLCIFFIVYALLAVYILYKLLRGFEPNFESIMEIITQMAYLLFCPLIYIILCRQRKAFSRKESVFSRYYNMQFQGEDKLKYAKSTTISEVRKSIVIPCLFIGIISFFYIIDLDRLVAIYEPIRNKIIGEGPVGIIIGIYGLIIALFQWRKTELDKRCMFSSVDNLPIFKKCSRQIALMTSVLIVYIISYFVVNYKTYNIEILYVIELMCFVLFIRILWELICMFYEQVDIERNVLRKIDRYYHTEKILMLPQRVWYKGTAISKFTGLLNKYSKVTNKIKLEEIEQIAFASIVSDGHNNKKRAVGKFYLYSICAFIILVVAIYFLTRSMTGSLRIIYGCVMIIGFLPVIFLWLSPKMLTSNHAFINWMTYISMWGYYIKIEGKKWERYTSSYGTVYSIYQKLILELKRVICFYNLSIKMKYHDEEDFGECGIDNICAYISDKEYKGENVDFMIIPLLICVCIYENKGKSICDSVEKTIENINVSMEMKEKISDLCLAVLRDLHGDDRTFEKQRYVERLDELLNRKNGGVSKTKKICSS